MLDVFLFELQKRSKLISTYVFFGVLFGAGFLWMNTSGGAFDEASVSHGTKVWANAPRALMLEMNVIGFITITIVSSIFARGIAVDFETDIHSLIFVTPLSTPAYFFGRFAGAAVVYLLIALAVPLGFAAGSIMPYLDPALVGPNRFAAYMLPYAYGLVPNALALGCIFFAVAALTRKPFASQITSILLLVGYLASSRALTKLDHKWIADLVDPFGQSAVTHLTEYWTTAEKNSLLVPMGGWWLVNRALWLSLGLGVLVIGYLRFKRTYALSESARPVAQDEGSSMIATRGPVVLSTATADYLWHLPRLAWLQFKSSIRNRSFIVITLAGMAMMIVSAYNLSNMYDTSTLPVTYMMLEVATQAFAPFMLAITTFFGGDLVWRDRDARVNQIVDALPVPTWLLFTEKLLALIGVQLFVTALIMLTGIVMQMVQGYFELELVLYVKQLFLIDLTTYFAVAALCLFVQTLVNEKYVAHFVVVAYFVFSNFMGEMGLEHTIYNYGMQPRWMYSAMNRYGHFTLMVVAFSAYWFAAAVTLAIVAGGLYVRGVGVKRRVPGVAALSFVVFALLGAYIYYNTNVLNRYRTSFEKEAEKARFEREYKSFDGQPLPKIDTADLAVDVYPSERRTVVRADLRVTNRSAQPIDRFLFDVDRNAKLKAFTGMTAEKHDEGLNLYVMRSPLAPGESKTITCELEIAPKGFRNSDENNTVVENGTFVQKPFQFGYSRESELVNDGKRKKHGLEAREDSMPKPDAPRVRDVNIAGNDADWMNLHTVISTSADQLAIAPGRMVKEWREGDRRFFEYRMDGKIANFYAFQSGRYEARRDTWKDVALEINYHPGHTYNLDAMFAGMKAGLEYMTREFSPYQHPLVRIVEFPRYEGFAMALPNTVPYSEAIGFIARVDPSSDTDVNYPFFVTAHEVAHQWWGHQLLPAFAQGSEMLSESLAEYSALMVMKHSLGDEQMRRFLKNELDQYLRGRSHESNRERPLMYVEVQPYVHYQKGSLALYALADAIGEDVLNKAIAGYLKKVAFSGPPYPVSTDFVADIEKSVPVEYAYLVEDLFKTITLYDNGATEATASKRDDGKYDVTVKVAVKKMRADGLGDEHEVEMNDFIDVGWVDQKGAVHTERKRFSAGELAVTFVADEMPTKAGIDPMHKLIDRKSDDNTVAVQ